jgi:hypothetical protein
VPACPRARYASRGHTVHLNFEIKLIASSKYARKHASH